MADNTEDNFIGMLLNETCENETSSEPVNGNVVDLRSYFEQKVNEVEFIDLKAYLTANEIKFVEMKLESQTGMYRTTLNSETLDFPKNWSVFAHLDSVNYYANITNEDYLNDIFSELVGYPYQLTFVNESDHFEMIFVPESNIAKCREWLMNYANKREDLLKAA